MTNKNEWEKEFYDKFLSPRTMWAQDESGKWYGKEDVKQFISSLLAEREKEVKEKYCSVPMGVTRWKEYGIEYGYWDYWMEQRDKEILKKMTDWHDMSCPFIRLDTGVCNCEIDLKKLIKE